MSTQAERECRKRAGPRYVPRHVREVRLAALRSGYRSGHEDGLREAEIHVAESLLDEAGRREAESYFRGFEDGRRAAREEHGYLADRPGLVDLLRDLAEREKGQ
jgi:hypothetical protein